MTTINLELAKELQSLCKEKNLTMPDGYNWWIKNKGNKDIYTFPVQYIHPAECLEILAPAFTLDELLDWLPPSIYTERLRLLNLDKGNDGYGIGYGYEFDSGMFVEENPANACAKLLIWLIKEGLI